jgi:hypothetical protein
MSQGQLVRNFQSSDSLSTRNSQLETFLRHQCQNARSCFCPPYCIKFINFSAIKINFVPERDIFLMMLIKYSLKLVRTKGLWHTWTRPSLL